MAVRSALIDHMPNIESVFGGNTQQYITDTGITVGVNVQSVKPPVNQQIRNNTTAFLNQVLRGKFEYEASAE